MANITTPLNYTSPDFDRSQCTIDTCPLELASLDYLPNVPWNIAYVVVFGAVLLCQGFFTWRHKTWGFGAGMFGGLILELIGYVGRVQLHNNPFSDGPFLMSLCTLTIAPAFLSASIYLCLSRVVVVFGEEIFRFKPWTYTVIFVTCDLFSLILQAAGGAIASMADTDSLTDVGINIMIGGLSFQVFSLTLFLLFAADIAWRVRKTRMGLSAKFVALRASRGWTWFLVALLVATIAIFVRSAFRVAELQGGFHGELANNEVIFMLLEGACIIVAVVALTVFHPGVVFKGQWEDAAWNFRSKRQSVKAVEDVESGSRSSMEMMPRGERAETRYDGRGI